MAQSYAEVIRARVEEDWGRLTRMLADKIALRAVSAEGIPGEQMRRSAEFVAEQMRLVGIDARVVQAESPDGGPGAWEVIGAKIVDPSAPTVLLYAHHDVQPVPSHEGWQSEPFEATEIDGRLYGRGSADDGGGLVMHSGALKALGDELKVNVKIFIEGEEEMGSPSFIPFIQAHRDEFTADVIVVADSGNWAPEVPSLTTSLRGNTSVDVTVRALTHPVHSGQYGGPILDSHTLAAMLIASMYDADGTLAVPGVAAEEPIGGLQQDVDETGLRRDTGAVDSLRLAGTGSIASRMWTKPSVTVIGFDAQPVDGSFNVISPATRFRLSLRTAPNQNPKDAQDALIVFLKEHAPFGAEIEVERGENGSGWGMDPDAPATHAALEAMEEGFGVAPVNQGQGGSIPFVPELQRIFPDAQVLVTGPEDPQANAHSPNESVSIAGLKANVVAEALMLAKLGQ